MNLEARISSIRDLLINGDLSEAITTTSELVDEIGKDSFNYNIYLIHEQYNQLIRENVEGGLSREHMLLERNKITLSVLQLLQVIQYQESERKKKPFFYAQAAIAALSLLLIISVAYIFFSRESDTASLPSDTTTVEQPEDARPTIVNSHPEEVSYHQDTMVQNLNMPTNESYFDAVPEEVSYQQNIFNLAEDEFGITLRFVDTNKDIDELLEAPISISVSRLKNKLIEHFDLEQIGENGEWQLFANDKRISSENRNLEGAGLFDYDLITIVYLSTEEEMDQAEGISSIENEAEEYSTEAEDFTESTATTPAQEQASTALATIDTPPIFTQREVTRSSRPPARTVDGPPRLPEIEQPAIEEDTTQPQPQEIAQEASDQKEETPEKEKTNRKERSKEKEERKKETSRDKQTFSYLIFVPGETSVHLRQSNEVFDTKTSNFYTRNAFTEEDLSLLTSRKLLIRDRDGQKLYTSLRSSGNQYFVAVEGGVGASEEDFYTVVVAGRKMAAVPISSKEYDRLLKVANSSFKGPRVDNVSVKGNGQDFTKKSIILSKK
ncbi:MAG: hypothetical protein AAF806_07290 [Bacteroidota bacterium]